MGVGGVSVIAAVCDMCGASATDEEPVRSYTWEADIRAHGGTTAGEALMCRSCAIQDDVDYQAWSDWYDETHQADDLSVHGGGS